MIHVCFGLHDADGKYSKFVGASMASIFENTAAPVTVHILHDDTLTDDNREKFSLLAKRYGQSVKFYNVEKLCPNEMKFLREKLADKIQTRFSIGAFYRLLIKNIFGTGKFIYLDADIIVNTDIAELWRVDMKNFPVAAVSEIDATYDHMITDKFLINAGIVRAEDYFCSGVVIFRLDALTEKFFEASVQFLATYPACETVDQDSLNAFFSENYLRLPQKFDSFVGPCSDFKLPVDKKIYHYAGNAFGLDADNAYDKLWLEYFTRTPWFNVEIFGRLGTQIRKSSEEFIRQMHWLMKIDRDKSRTFFIAEKYISTIVPIFGQRADDEFIDTERTGYERISAAFDKLVEQMNAQRGRKIFFLMDMYYQELRAELVQLGFVEYADFVDGLSFLSSIQCGRVRNEYDFIRVM